ncbi:MAG: helix-turn-helix transcriptional regulator [Balneolaceae bacterium]|nr:helix-turn-helix transcriptional regulator [Balneolaceae bacterium]
MIKQEPKSESTTTELSAFNSYKAKKTVRILVHEIESIPDVKSWSRQSNVSRGWLVKVMKGSYGLSPKEVLRQVRYERIVQLLENDVEATSYSIAKDSGLSSGDALRMFLRRHHDTNFRCLRRQIINGKHQVEWQWLGSE